MSSGVDESIIDLLRPVLAEFARARNCALLPVPIALQQRVDEQYILRLLDAIADCRSERSATFDTPETVIRQVGRCRIVVTCAYHAAVFALAQGIPAVCLYGSEYFRYKFEGLASMFPEGCRLVSLAERSVPDIIRAHLNDLYDGASAVRAQMLTRARGQITASRAAYREVFERIGAVPALQTRMPAILES
jgi:colanic acid/amylovoran biosynthesis protein